MKIKEKLYITGRGIVFVVELQQFENLPDRIYNIKELEPYIKIGQKLNYKYVDYEIIGLEYAMKLMDPPFLWKKDSVGLRCRETKGDFNGKESKND